MCAKIPPVSVPIDSSKPYRWPSELMRLVDFVTQANPNDESTWIEWKSTLDLNDKSGHQHIAKHVLGFANRTVATARHHTGGYAYLIVGAEPGNVGGITPVDLAKLQPWIVGYVGSAVRWRAEYVSVQKHQVLVVIVDPPENGDPIHPVRQPLGDHPRGRILVRRQGSTAPANDHEIDQLTQRVRAGQGALEFTIEPIFPVIERRPEWPDRDGLTEVERAALLARPRADTQRHSGLSAGLEVLVAAVAGMSTVPDDRSDEDYVREVDRYCDDYRHVIDQRFVWRLVRHRPIWLRLEAVNLTEDNFTDIELQIHIPGEVCSWPDRHVDIADGDLPALPERPAPLGTRKPSALAALADRPIIKLWPPETCQAPGGLTGPGFTIRDGGSVTIDFEPFDLRPRQRHPLDEVPLSVGAVEGTALDCRWTATAGNASGQQTGNFTITVASSTLDVNSL